MRCLFAVLLVPFVLPGQSIQYSDARKVWLLTTSHSLLRDGRRGRRRAAQSLLGRPALAPRRPHRPRASPRHLLLRSAPDARKRGVPRLGRSRATTSPRSKSPAPDGDRDLVLHYASHRIDRQRPRHHPQRYSRRRRSHPALPRLPRPTASSAAAPPSATARPQPLTLESAQSATWYLPPGEGYQLTYLTGRWAAETQINHEPIHEGTKVLESRKGHTSHNFNPVVRHRRRRRRRRARPRLVRRAGLERQLAHHRRADALPPGARHRRLQHVRFRLSAASPASRSKRRRSTAAFPTPGFGGASRMLHRFERDADPARRRAIAPAPGALQLLGSHHLPRRRGRPESARR